MISEVGYTLIFYLLLLLLFKLAEIVAFRGQRVKGEVFHEWTMFSFYVPAYSAFLMPLVLYVYVPFTLNYWISVPAVFVFLGAVVIRYFAYKELRELAYPHIRIKKKHALISSGLYKYVRHPVYLAYLLAVFSAPLILNSFVSLAFSATFLLGLFMRIEKEEEVLSKHVRGYKQYVKKTWKLLPPLW
ncbi:hypothetical protein COT72_05365 [archaeon CG10_big_fil_rev_8_21_14_0_10_43_11]|nr:MAG: hypothetical protein COT72_05365 [archaeon CG10_big_fil_rev_8_21_14_0_10_43_11]